MGSNIVQDMAKYTDANIDAFNSLDINQCGKLEVDENGDAVITNGNRTWVHHCYVAKFHDHQGDGVYGEIKFEQDHSASESDKILSARTAIKTMDVKEPPIVDGADFTNEKISVDLS